MKRLRNLSITARITIGSLLVAALFALIAVGVVRAAVSSILDNATESLLNNDLSTPTAALMSDPAGPVKLPEVGEQIAVISPAGVVAASTLSPAIERHLSYILSHPQGKRFGLALGDAHYQVLIRSVSTTAGEFRVIAARNDQTTSLILTRLTVAMLVGAAILILGFGAASWYLARTALRPVSAMREQADHIAGGEGTPDETDHQLLSPGPANDELAALAKTLNNLISRLRLSAERERQMVSDASHELRTPLAVLRGQLELAELNAGDAAALLSDIRAAHTTSLRLADLANNLLELSRIQAGPQTGRTGWRPLLNEFTDAVDRARLLVSSDENNGPITVDFDYNPTKQPPPQTHVALSGTDLGRVLDNLLGNAIAAIRSVSPTERTKEGNVIATVSVVNDQVVLSVRDNGPGMPDDFLPHALNRFTRPDDARTSRSGSGGGLGLAIVAALAESAGGSVVLANRAEGGLSVTLTLPLIDD